MYNLQKMRIIQIIGLGTKDGGISLFVYSNIVTIEDFNWNTPLIISKKLDIWKLKN